MGRYEIYISDRRIDGTMMKNEQITKGILVDSEIGMKKTDSEGSPVSGARMDTAKAYSGIPELLQKVINENNTTAWADIVRKIDYIYEHIGYSLGRLDNETGFCTEVRSQIKSGKKLFFKPNLVSPAIMDLQTHGEDPNARICTDWSVIAALMRWFHDSLEISYHQMALGEASTSGFLFAEMYSKSAGRNISTETVFEGKSGDFYGGWGFYFVRRYLSGHHPSSHTDDPMQGYEESVTGTYLPPGQAADRLMIYDLNKLGDISRGRTVPVPDGANFREITLHKVIIGGDPGDIADLKDYPGCVLVNVPKMKIHDQDLLTNAIKNLGIGLYPTQCPDHAAHGKNRWKYAFPVSQTPSYKGKLPHMPWVAEIDETTNLPLKDETGEYILTKTAGFPGTQSDVIRAVQNQGVFMIHVSDAIDMINNCHSTGADAIRIPEGYIWSSLDCVALDLVCARYCFKTVPMREGLILKEKNGWITEFVHHVPVAEVKGSDIVTTEGLDSPLFRYNLYRYAEERSVGMQQYYITGWDSVTNTPLVSLGGHLGRIDNNTFVELITKTTYYASNCFLWDMQKTLLSYAEAHDRLTGTSILHEFLDKYDENHDGVIDYDEFGKKGLWTPGFSILAYTMELQLTENYGLLKGGFYQTATFGLKNSRKDWNPEAHDFMYDFMLKEIGKMAYNMSRTDSERADPYIPGMKWGKGKWPGWRYASGVCHVKSIYGSDSAAMISLNALYGMAFQYADKTGNNGGYTGSTSQDISDPRAISKYFDAVSKGTAPLDFTVYVPEGFGTLGAVKIPNVEETGDPARIFTAHFNQGQEIW
jgi:hypothetical protein